MRVSLRPLNASWRSSCTAGLQAGGDIRAAEQEAGKIYSKYGEFTTAASAIASWAVIHAAFDL